MYVVTVFTRYYSNVAGDSIESEHPAAIKLASGEIVNCDEDTRTNAINDAANKEFQRTGRYNVSGMISIHPQIKFRIVSKWNNDCQSSGSRIRWSIPKDAKLVFSPND